MDVVASSDSLSEIRKLAALMLAAAAKESFPEVLLIGGGATSLGFYYDFSFPFVFQQGFLALIEENMMRLAKQNHFLTLKEMVPFSAKEYFLHHGETLRAEFAEKAASSLVSIISFGKFFDMIPEPLSLSYTGDLQAVKLKSFELVGNIGRAPIVRIWGAAETDRQKLKEFLKKEKSFSKKSHVEIGKELSLFTFEEDGLLWHPKGESVKAHLKSYLHSQLKKRGFSFISREANYLFDEEGVFHPINKICAKGIFPIHFPSRIAEEQSFFDPDCDDSTLGLIQASVTHFDVQYIFCRENELFEESISSLQFISEMLKILGFEFHLTLSARRINTSKLSSDERKCIEVLTRSAHQLGLEFSLVEDRESHEGARISFLLLDALDRKWPCSFLHLSLDKAERSRGRIVRSTWGSIERLIALLIEKYEGLPFTLAPEQVKVISVNEKARPYANKLESLLTQEGVLVGKDSCGGSFKDRVRKGVQERVPFLLVVGEKELASQSVMLRRFGSEDSELMTVDKMVSLLKKQTKPELKSELQNK